MLFGTILGLASMFPPTYAPKIARPLREIDGGATVRCIIRRDDDEALTPCGPIIHAFSPGTSRL